MERYRQAILIALAVVVADQLTKGLLRFDVIPSEVVTLLPLIRYQPLHLQAGWTGAGHTWLDLLWVVGGLGALALLVFGARRTAVVEGAPSPAWWLAAGGLLGNIIDLAWGGEVLTVLVVQVGDTPIFYFNLAHLALLVAATWLLANVLLRSFTRQRPALELLTPGIPLPEFGQLRRGIDNIHVDVHLSPAFTAATRNLISAALRFEMLRNRYGEKSDPVSRKLYDKFRVEYDALLNVATHRARNEGVMPTLYLAQFAAAKFVIDTVQAEFGEQMGKMRAQLYGEKEGQGPNALMLYDRIFNLARERDEIEFRLKHDLFEQMFQADSSSGADLRQSLLGQRWPVPRELLYNPLLHASDPHDSRLLLDYYVLIGKRTEEWRSLGRLQGFVDGTLNHCAGQPRGHIDAEAAAVWLAGSDWAACKSVFDFREPGSVEQRWSDEPGNLDLLFDPNRYAESMRSSQAAGDDEKVRTYKVHRRFQQRMLRRLERFFRDQSLLRRTVVAYEMVPVYRANYRQLNPLLVYQFLLGGPGHRDALRQIKAASRNAENPLNLKPLFGLVKKIARCPPARQRGYVARFVHDFFSYRRDLKNYCIVHGAMEQLRIIESEQDVKLSRANNRVYEFLREEEAGPATRTVRAHTVVKADLRGSTKVTSDLLKRGLNPATHFEQNFFGPINRLFEAFAAEKVFMEGDAVIAALLDYEDTKPGDSLLARSCGLAVKILEVVQAHNDNCRRHGLPQLQVGIGVAFSPEAPTYLFDGEQPVMISPAIGRADRLSSSSWRLREEGDGPGPAVRVYQLAKDHPLYGEKGQTDLRYNVNGVELEQAGYDQLTQEIKLRRISAPRGFDDKVATFLLGHFRDARGVLQPLVIRQGQVRMLNTDGPGESTGRSYYEVITDTVQVDRVVKAAKAREQQGAAR